MMFRMSFSKLPLSAYQNYDFVNDRSNIKLYDIAAVALCPLTPSFNHSKRPTKIIIKWIMRPVIIMWISGHNKHDFLKLLDEKRTILIKWVHHEGNFSTDINGTSIHSTLLSTWIKETALYYSIQKIRTASWMEKSWSFLNPIVLNCCYRRDLLNLNLQKCSLL